MKVRYKNNLTLDCFSSNFNVHGIGEVIVMGDWGADSSYISDLDVFLPEQSIWKDMREAFRDHDLITDNYNTYFFEPKNIIDKERGFTL